MKKRTVLLLVGVVLVGSLLSQLLPTSPTASQKQPQSKTTKAWGVNLLTKQESKPLVKPTIETNTTTNKKPTVTVYGFTVTTVGESLTLHSRTADEDGEVVGYLWEEKGEVLGENPEVEVLLSKEGRHTITLRVTDNLGAMAKGSIEIEVYAQYDKKTFSKHRDCGCESVVYHYFNEEGNITKEISQGDRNGIVIKEFTYGEEGELLSVHYKNYADQSRLIEERTTLYDRFGNEIEEFGKEDNYEDEKGKLVSFHKYYKYDDKGNVIERRFEKEGVLEMAEKEIYLNDKTKREYITETYKDGILESRDIALYRYDEKGNLLHETSQVYDAKTETTTLMSSRELRYNEAGEILETREDEDGDGVIESSHEYVYDEENHLLKESSNNEESSNITHYSYSSEGLVLKEVTTEGENSIEFIKYYSYNSAGQKTSSRTDDDGDGSIDYEFKIFYDEEGHRIKEESYTDGRLFGANSYNSNGKITSIAHGDYRTTFIYNKETGLLEKKIKRDPLGRVTIRTYDERGELLREIDENGNILYEVDVRG